MSVCAEQLGIEPTRRHEPLIQHLQQLQPLRMKLSPQLHQTLAARTDFWPAGLFDGLSRMQLKESDEQSEERITKSNKVALIRYCSF